MIASMLDRHDHFHVPSHYLFTGVAEHPFSRFIIEGNIFHSINLNNGINCFLDCLNVAQIGKLKLFNLFFQNGDLFRFVIFSLESM
jgi:hypothetical protein